MRFPGETVVHDGVDETGSAESEVVGRHVWRLSGRDMHLHALRIDGGYLEPRAMLSIFGNATYKTNAEVESYGPYDVWVAACGHLLPIAMALPPVGDTVCAGCRLVMDTPPVRSPCAGPHVRDWSKTEPLRRRPNADASGDVSPATGDPAVSLLDVSPIPEGNRA